MSVLRICFKRHDCNKHFLNCLGFRTTSSPSCICVFSVSVKPYDCETFIRPIHQSIHRIQNHIHIAVIALLKVAIQEIKGLGYKHLLGAKFTELAL